MSNAVIDTYLEHVPMEYRAALQRVRVLAHQAIPDLEETIGYGMPVLKYKHKYLLGFCAFTKHMSVFPGGEATTALQDKLTGYKTAKGTIQFTTENELPEALLIEILLLCKQRIDAST